MSETSTTQAASTQAASTQAASTGAASTGAASTGAASTGAVATDAASTQAVSTEAAVTEAAGTGGTRTLTTQTAAMALQNIPALIGLVAGNRLVTVNATIQAALTSAQADASGEIVRLKAAFDAFEAENPMVAAALDAARRSSVALGLDFPAEDQVFAQVKAAAVDLIGALLAQPAK